MTALRPVSVYEVASSLASVTNVPAIGERGAIGPRARRIITSVSLVGLVHDKVIEVLTGVALTAVTGPGAASELAGAGGVSRAGLVGAVNRGVPGVVTRGVTGTVSRGDTGAVWTGDTGAVWTGDTGAGDDAEATSAWNTTEVKIPAKPIIHTVRRTTKRFIDTRFQSRRSPLGAT